MRNRFSPAPAEKIVSPSMSYRGEPFSRKNRPPAPAPGNPHVIPHQETHGHDRDDEKITALLPNRACEAKNVGIYEFSNEYSRIRICLTGQVRSADRRCRAEE
jgi:hypothetical protein